MRIACPYHCAVNRYLFILYSADLEERLCITNADGLDFSVLSQHFPS